MKTFLKWTGIVVGCIVVLLVVASVIVYFVSESALNQRFDVQVASLDVQPDSAMLARGEHLTAVIGCQSCHGANLGGEVALDVPPFRIVASNLTAGAGGVGQTYTDEDYIRAVRHGVRPDGSGLLMMPSLTYHNLSDEDLSAIIAYLRQAPPVDNELPPTEVRAIGRIVAATTSPLYAAEAIDHSETSKPAVAPIGVSAEYGAYLGSIVCVDCHGANLEGGKHPAPDGPAAPGLHGAGTWTLDQFKQAMRTGVTPTGREMPAEWMPWETFMKMTDEELEALHLHFQTLPAAPAQQTASAE